ncbi:T9SS type B sorting domain-containing protein [Maribacter sp. BPC-D8]|uniref:T9SS type B sorting domain-containing protein n=1 Tax=Maribacter sp. BPC-D8 TaxID=3053613 RepID=UPI002B472BFE|nr:T9SS type B sorting domain-containing protein [Maribacter sp. BPC-D8]WRI29469.1 T9SS type B sorting domain-containing protein [Maribacter sp. BPC-D8]
MIKKLSCLILFMFNVVIASAQLPLIELEALQALYNDTGGPNWISETDPDPTDNWVFATPLIDTDVTNWYGITVNNDHVTQVLLDVGGNTGNNLIGTIPNEIGDLQNLIDLDLSDQPSLTGPIPVSIGNLLNLEILFLNGNELSGNIPPILGGLSNLTTLWLNANNLTGTIPPTLGNLGNLESLLLSGNQLTGTIPTELGNLNNLMSLWLSNNDLIGEIPPELGLLSNLRQLLLNNNNLTGEIPESIYGLMNLLTLQLEFNQLEGAISPLVENLVSLEILILRNNQFEGDLPEEIGNITTLLTLWLGQNNFTGTIPDSFSGLINLGGFEVNDNNIEGILPAGLVNWTNISSLNIMNNRIGGDIPNFIFSNTTTFRINGNRFQFGDFEDEFSYYESFLFFIDTPQALVNDIENITACVDGSITLSTTVSGSANVYQWFKDGVAVPNSNTPDLVLTNLQVADTGVYTCEISSTIVTDLLLERNPITLTVNNDGPTANDVDDIVLCDTDTDGFATFNLDLVAIESQVIGSQTGLIVSYFDATGNAITLTDIFTNTTANQQDITVRVEASETCFDETIFSLIVNPLTVADVFSDVEVCNAYVLPGLSPFNSYYTATGGAGSILNAGDEVTESQIIYVYAESASGTGDCFDESSFLVNITEVLVSEFEDVIACQTYTLPILPDGQDYYSEADGNGSILLAGDEISASTIVYVFAEENGCFNQSRFTINIDPIACQGVESLGLPKFFTPNNDSYYDVWDTSKLSGTGDIGIFIYDRYGKLLKQLDPNTSNSSWDGMYNGNQMPSNDYWFKYLNYDTGIRLSGHFSLKR